jgi:hypothetical protein
VKFQRLLTLLQYLETAETPPRCYLVLEQDKEERKRSIRKLAEKLSLKTISFEGGDFTPVYSALSSPSLFGEEEVIIWDGVKKISDTVVSYVKNPGSHCFFIIGGDSLKPFVSLEGAALLNTTEEKPWDKEKRIQSDLLYSIKAMGKTITPAAASFLLTISGKDIPALEAELSKVALYIGEKKEITEKDVLAIASFSSKAKGFQQAESLVWEGTFTLEEVDTSYFISLIGQVRFLLQQGRQIGLLLYERKGAEEIGKILGIRSSKQVQKVIDRLKKRKLEYFEKALSALYDLELLSKSSTLSPQVLLDTLRIKLTKLKREYAR